MESSTFVDLSESQIIQIKEALALDHKQPLTNDLIPIWEKLNIALTEINEMKEEITKFKQKVKEQINQAEGHVNKSSCFGYNSNLHDKSGSTNTSIGTIKEKFNVPQDRAETLEKTNTYKKNLNLFEKILSKIINKDSQKQQVLEEFNVNDELGDWIDASVCLPPPNTQVLCSSNDTILIGTYCYEKKQFNVNQLYSKHKINKWKKLTNK